MNQAEKIATEQSADDFMTRNRKIQTIVKLFPNLYKYGLNLAHSEEGMCKQSIAACLYAQGFVKGFLKTYCNIDLSLLPLLEREEKAIYLSLKKRDRLEMDAISTEI